MASELSAYLYLERMFAWDTIRRDSRFDIVQVSPENNNVYNVFLGFTCKGDKFEIPLHSSASVEHTLLNTENRDALRIAIPLYFDLDSSTIEAKSFRTIMTKFLRRPGSYSWRLCRVNLSDILFYMSLGLILDENLKPLMLITLECSVDTYPTIESFSITKIVCRVSPRVFAEKNPMTRGIIGTLLPMFAAEPYTLECVQLFSKNISGKIRIVIDDIDDWICTPNKMQNPTLMDADLNSMLHSSSSLLHCEI